MRTPVALPKTLTAVVAAAWLVGLTPAARAGNAVALRAARHPGFTRLVLDFPALAATRVQRHGDAVCIGFSGDYAVVAPPGFDPGQLHNLRGVRYAAGSVVLTLSSGVRLQSLVLGSRRVIDLLDPASTPSIGIAAIPSRQVVAAPPSAIAPAAATLGPVAMSRASVAPVATGPVARVDGPASEPPVRAPLAAAQEDPAAPLVLAFAPGTGAAAFRLGGAEIVVFDEPRAIDPAVLRASPGYQQAQVQQLPTAVVLRLPLPPGRGLRLAHDGMDWSLTPDDAAAGEPITLRADAGTLTLAAPGAGRSVTIPDPQSGDTLLVGTQTRPGPHMAGTHRYPDCLLLPTQLGVAVEPLADRTDLRATPDGFVIDSDRPGTQLAISPIAPDTAMSLAAVRLTRQFALPDDTPAALLRRLQNQVADAASVPLQARLPYRRAVAQTMLALGMGAEAQSVLQVAATDDPRALADPTTQDLSAAAALLAGRLEETAALAALAIGEPDERRLWRALRDAALLDDGTRPDPATVRSLAQTLPLLLSYPTGLRRSLLPLVADTLLRGHDLSSAGTLLASLPDEPDLALARAVDAAARGQDDTALAAYDRIAAGADWSARARAGVEALKLRLADHRITPAQAADAGDRLVYAWRGDARERDLRLQVADWRGQAGQYRAQLAALREAAEVFADPADGMRANLAQAFAALLSPDAAAGIDQLPPLDLVALMQDNADLLPDGPAGEELAGRLADRLVALDLPQQSIDVLAKAMASAPAGRPRAALGARLATLDLAAGQAAAAADVLAQSSADAVSPVLAEQRTLLQAKADDALGHRPAALASLAPLTDPPALLARAAVQENAQDWRGADASLGAYVTAALPVGGALDSDQSSTVLRLASAAAQAGDKALLGRLRTDYARRLPDTNDAALLALLTEAPVKDPADLPRAARETEAARAVVGHAE